MADMESKDSEVLTPEMMKYFWDAYTTVEQRKLHTVAPLQASDEQLKGLPPALILTGEKDVLCSEAEEYAKRLKLAGVKTVAARYLGTDHGLLALPQFEAEGDSALAQTVDMLRRTWNSPSKLEASD
ncbi:alpha/beta hydrolase fold-domain-containing protein [Radiomyces spectabilis]|uniref:alpha/beta hydrolase fold-domain-containing protein n=1 Tax=Radiomyces spectabilis TaxID=64574 RepID=UPI0022206803|nr:alpha/beta hydrolase fold-domain-containing protein [Radiomyces spectabilis]KAI8379482.1 alpha/beta hydrolase fold-domain-containing protein [Radiomyces spectabilis]